MDRSGLRRQCTAVGAGLVAGFGHVVQTGAGPVGNVGVSKYGAGGGSW